MIQGAESAKPTGVLLLNLGGPDSLSAVKPFLYNLFSDREIIRLGPSFLQKPVACMIASMRAEKTKKAYALIGGRSPINEITYAQAAALEKELGTTIKVFSGMRYWSPFVKDVLKDIYNKGIRRLIVLSLYPQYSVATTGSSLSEFRKVLSEYPDVSAHEIRSWHTEAPYIDAIVESIRKGLKDYFPDQKDVHLLFSAHSLPVKFILEGDPYEEHIRATITEVTERINMPWSLSYQSKSGPVQWLEPSTEKMIEELAAGGVKKLLVFPVSFVSDHIETLYEIDMLYKDMAAARGIRLERADSLNLSPRFIAALKEIVIKAMKEAQWSE